MQDPLPDLYFRTRDNGAMVFRVEIENRFRRIEMTQIAVVNVKNGEVKPHGGRELSGDEAARIAEWLEARRKVLKAREVDDILRTVDHLNQTAAWAQQKASAEELDAVSDALLLAMHDLRSVLVRKKADRLAADESGGD
jgi:hypothetical protein